MLATVAACASARAEEGAGDRGEALAATRQFVSVRGNAGPLSQSSSGYQQELNSFFATVDAPSEFKPVGFEVMKQHLLLLTTNTNTRRNGWRGNMIFNDWSLALGEEVVGTLPVAVSRIESVRSDFVRTALEASRVTPYVTAGIRAMRNNSEFYFQGSGSVLGRVTVSTLVEHDIIGPQLGMGLVAETSMFRFEAVALGLIGYGQIEYEQYGIFGEEAIPGALNRSATARTTYSLTHARGDDEFAWHGETRLTASCNLTQRLRFDATWRWFLTGPVYSAYDATAWNAPDFGLNEVDGETVTAHGWFLGLTYTR